MKPQTATVVRTTKLNGGGWQAIVQPTNRAEKQFVPVEDNHPEGTRLTLIDGVWRKP